MLTLGENAVHELDCKGLNCPMPIVRLSQAMRTLAAGESITIFADDPA
ncbi:MAG TPA: sulfurtransferase TusA family protein, partial [Nannocystis exedens]|nr:sulfurtransferase TusA family protein [Nannocystis exedens]